VPIKVLHQIFHHLWKVRDNSYFNGSPPVVPLCSQINSFHTLSPRVLKFILILSCILHPGLLIVSSLQVSLLDCVSQRRILLRRSGLAKGYAMRHCAVHVDLTSRPGLVTDICISDTFHACYMTLPISSSRNRIERNKNVFLKWFFQCD
jgi:hypothetical protein